jgi:hypothetical protein
MSKDIPVLEIERGVILDKQHLPHALNIGHKLNTSTVRDWITDRALPLSRKNADKLYKTLGLSRDNSETILMFKTHALSINDNYWIADQSELGWLRYENINLFSNRFNRALGTIALRGDEGLLIRGNKISPEYTGQGTLPKCFIKEDNEIYMYKHAPEQQMYNEIASSYIANILGFNSATYKISKYQGVKCTKSKILSNEHVNWETAYSLSSMFHFTEYKVPQNFASEAFKIEFSNMIIFDALVLNVDRHMQNWAFEFDADTNELIGLAPSFDYNWSFTVKKDEMSKLMFDNQKQISLLKAARIAYRDKGTTLKLQELHDTIDLLDLKINKEALKNRILYITGNKDSQKDCF